MKKLIITALCTILAACAVPQKTETECVAGAGCCSRHGGVSGCSKGRARCADGTLSPTCGCYKEDNDIEV